MICQSSWNAVMRFIGGISASFLLFGIAQPASSEVRLAAVLTSHMVVQRDQPTHIWGTAQAGEKVVVQFRSQSAGTQADRFGQWSVYLAPGSAGGPFSLTVQGSNLIKLDDVLVGDLWLASGQSNMQFAMSDRLKDGAAEIAAATHPDIRLLSIQQTFSDSPLDEAKTSGWAACTPETVKTFSAVAYFFGRELQEKEKVPIGLIHASWGGTPAEAWTSLSALSADPALMPVFAARAEMMSKVDETRRQQAYEERENSLRRSDGRPALDVPWRPNPDTWAPAALFNGMIAPLIPLPIRGVIWYQGESNTDAARAPMYERLFKTMIEDWRDRWHQPEMPFLFVQLANYKTDDDWPTVREAQRRTLALRNTGMAVAVDIGEANNIHPADKQDVGHRLALWARSLSYGESLDPSGPLFRSATPEGKGMRVAFDHANGLRVSNGALQGFELADESHRFFPASARVNGSTLFVESGEVSIPKYIRYDWAHDPRGTLINAAGLPASPFSSR